jgi:WD40 repeat protein
MDSWESDAEGFRNSIYEMYARQLNIPNKEEAVPVMGVQFHPDSQKFLVNSGESVSIRNSVDGRLLQSFSFNDFGVQHTMDPPLAFFIDKGNQVVAYSRQSMSLWDVKSGQPLDNVQRSDELLEGERPVSSPNAEYLSFVVKTDEGPVRQIWSGGENLQLVASYQTEKPKHKRSAPEIAFSGNQIYALSKSPGLVELRDMKTHELIPNGEIRVGSSSESSEIEIVGLDTDYSGKWLVISASTENDLFLELWSIVHRNGVRLRVPKPSTPDRKQYLSRVEFDPSGDWFSVILTEIEKLPPRPGVRYMGNAPDEYRTVKTTPYVVDVFKTIAKAKQ